MIYDLKRGYRYTYSYGNNIIKSFGYFRTVISSYNRYLIAILVNYKLPLFTTVNRKQFTAQLV